MNETRLNDWATGPVVVMGVSGCGKSTVGAALATTLGVPFGDADDLHPPANIAIMADGRPLTDAEREPWLEVVGEWLAAYARGGVMSCSALRRRYRDQLRRHCPGLRFVHLAGSPELIARRHAGRRDHFMPGSLNASQFRTLEPLEADEDGLVVSVEAAVDAIVAEVIDAFGLRQYGARGARN